MIREGKEGSLCFFWRGKLITSFPVDSSKGQYPDEFFTSQADNIILQMMRITGFTIKEQINHYKLICNDTYERKMKGQGIWRSDYELFAVAIYALRKLKFIDDELHVSDGIMSFPKYKRS
jgi:hypothetical protein